MDHNFGWGTSHDIESFISNRVLRDDCAEDCPDSEHIDAGRPRGGRIPGISVIPRDVIADNEVIAQVSQPRWRISVVVDRDPGKAVD
jgi:hypothetical protein